MNTLQKSTGHTPPRSRSLLTVQTVLTLITGSITFLAWSNDGGHIWKLYAGLFAGSMVSLLFRSGWLIPCLVCGTIIGDFSDPPIKGGSIESQMWETVSCLWTGTIVGLLIGYVIDKTLSLDETDNDGDSVSCSNEERAASPEESGLI